MSRIDMIIDAAHRKAIEMEGDDTPGIVEAVLAGMVDELMSGASSGFLRFPPISPAVINPRQPRSLEE